MINSSFLLLTFTYILCILSFLACKDNAYEYEANGKRLLIQYKAETTIEEREGLTCFPNNRNAKKKKTAKKERLLVYSAFG